MNELCRLLLIEPEAAIAQQMQNLLFPAVPSSLAMGITFQLTTVTTFSEGQELLKNTIFAVILLNLQSSSLSDPEALRELRNLAPQTALIAYTETDDETLVIQSFQAGADGYLRLQNLDSNLLIYELRSARERKDYLNDRERQQRIAQQEREFQDLEDLVNTTTSVTARMFGVETIQDSLPEIFSELSQTYGHLLDLALEQRAFKVDHRLSEQLRVLADKMGFLKASPRDVIELHTHTLREKNRDVTLAKAQVYVAEGRLLVLELMGYLTSFYRKYYIGLSNLNRFSALPSDH